MTATPLDRRAFLRGAGVTFALPWLETLAARLPAAWRTPPRRLCIVVTPNGMLPSAWHPVPPQPGEARDPELPGWMPSLTLAPLVPHAARVGVFTGLANRGSFAGDGHYAKVAPLLTGETIRRTGGRDLWNGVSLDQFAAQRIGDRTLLPSLELGCDPIYPVEDMGYSTVYGGHIAWSAPDRPVLKEIVPRQAFDRLFRGRRLAADEARTSVLDAVRRDSRRLAARLSAADRRKLDEYEEAVRAIERRIEAAASVADAGAFAAVELPEAGRPADYPTHVELMFDLIALAFRSDATRIVTFLVANEVSGRRFSWLPGCEGNFHDYSHHDGKPEKQEPYRRINRWYVERFAGLLDRLAAIDEGDGTVLDHSSIVLAAAMSDGNAHSAHDLPIVVAGGGHPTGRIESPADTPLCGLWLALLHRLGAAAERFGDAEQPLC
ncbi:MAG: DUF1552 domain-containing protein [Planctomycetes bacterium]|nr:DUF1552 domain-containing protein [Planctomycetota bacterium]